MASTIIGTNLHLRRHIAAIPSKQPTFHDHRYNSYNHPHCKTLSTRAITGRSGDGDIGVDHLQQSVSFFRHAWPYVQIHRGSTFVVVIAGEIVDNRSNLGMVLRDIAILRDLGIKVVVLPDTQLQVDRILREKGRKTCGITDEMKVEAAMDVAGKVESEIVAMVSPGPRPWNGSCRHGVDRLLQRNGVSVATGNFIAAKRRDIDGVDDGAIGEVKKIDVARIQEMLDSDCLVVLNSLGWSSKGEVLNCNTCRVASACALAMRADKVVFIVDGQTVHVNNQLFHYLTLQEAEWLITRKPVFDKDHDDIRLHICFGSDGITIPSYNREHEYENFDEILKKVLEINSDYISLVPSLAAGDERRLRVLDGYLSEVVAALLVCRGGVQSVHLIDGRLEGALLLEFFTRDGVGTMIAWYSFNTPFDLRVFLCFM